MMPLMQRHFIPNSAPWITQKEIDAVTTCLESGAIGSNERNLEPAKLALKQWVRGNEVLLTPSCTLALELALFVLHLKPGDEVILPSFTFVSCSNAILKAGGTPVFVDIEERTLNIDLDDVRRKITPKTRAIMPVHYAGISCDMDVLLDLAKERNIAVIEDAAHAIGAKYKGRPLGTLGQFGAFSFHDTKNCVCGEGGALVVNDTSHLQELECMRTR
ncbi:MAG: aminotransferase class I/II-fold pyridoxal phosphate-dependent enzyme [bacterium]|nr:aminotransferase class I/II-fold pyridoxal phosphate-dependent enzyme [bacterium]